MILLNGREVEIGKFPNQETRIDESAIKDIIAKQKAKRIEMPLAKDDIITQVTMQYENDQDLIHLMFVKKFLDELNVECDLIITYMPYSRMDRRDCGGYLFTLEYVSEFINSLQFNRVHINEPHSDVTPALIKRSKVINVSEMIFERALSEIEFDKDKDFVFYPDAGAEKRYSKSLEYNALVGVKQRDLTTGRIKRLDILGDVKEKGFKVVIIDDLCSKGGTFMLSAEKLKELGASEIYLVVAHCEDTVFDGQIPNSDLITKVFTSNSIRRSQEHEKIKVINYIFGQYGFILRR